MEPLELLQQIWLALHWTIIGLLGAVVASRWHRDEFQRRRDYLSFLLAGTACAHFFTDQVAAYLDVTGTRGINGIAFLLGAFGGALMAAVIRAIQAADLWALVKTRLGGGER